MKKPKADSFNEANLPLFGEYILIQTMINSIAQRKFESNSKKYIRYDLISKKIMRACKNYYEKNIMIFMKTKNISVR
jgi:hypothetical protein